ncbi:MAG: phosphate acyltransferase PlsX [Gemmatimonadetes bacterium]|nr:phosphate acyltransferase PlsX [Gemmatimonadota bacterium]
MGTDHHPAVEVEGAVRALRETNGEFRLVLVGDETAIRGELERLGERESDRLSVVHAADRIAPGEPAVTAVRRKPKSSIVIGLSLQKAGEADAFVSAGSTGAVMAASLFILRPLPGVDRPAIATLLPTASGPVVMLDAGANVDCKPAHLVQFARLGVVYAHDVLGRESPRVGLLNIGEEPEKGNELSVETHRLLTESDIRFVGNVEGREVITGACDVLVTDGFTGNVLLKFYESVAGFVFGLLRKEMADDQQAEAAIERATRLLDYAEYGGAPLLGVNGISIICHGGSPPRAISNALKAAMRASNAHMVGHIRDEVGVHPEAR